MPLYRTEQQDERSKPLRTLLSCPPIVVWVLLAGCENPDHLLSSERHRGVHRHLWVLGQISRLSILAGVHYSPVHPRSSSSPCLARPVTFQACWSRLFRLREELDHPISKLSHVHRPLPCLLSDPSASPQPHSPVRLVLATPRSAAPAPRKAAASDDSRPAAASNVGRVRFLPATAAPFRTISLHGRSDHCHQGTHEREGATTAVAVSKMRAQAFSPETDLITLHSFLTIPVSRGQWPV
jgi:hypothetical protein